MRIHFSLKTSNFEKDTRRANGYTERCSTSLTIRDMQIKTEMRHPLTLVTLSLKRRVRTSVGENAEKREPSCTTGGVVNCAANVETSMEEPQKIKNKITCDPAIPLLDLYFTGKENTISKRYLHPLVHSSIICNSQGRETT